MRQRQCSAVPVIPASRQTEVRHGRNFIRRGDLVRLHNNGKRIQELRFEYADEDRGGLYYCLVGARGTRFVRPEQVTRIASGRRKP